MHNHEGFDCATKRLRMKCPSPSTVFLRPFSLISRSRRIHSNRHYLTRGRCGNGFCSILLSCAITDIMRFRRGDTLQSCYTNRSFDKQARRKLRMFRGRCFSHFFECFLGFSGHPIGNSKRRPQRPSKSTLRPIPPVCHLIPPEPCTHRSNFLRHPSALPCLPRCPSFSQEGW